MTRYIIVSCNGPSCQRKINSYIHAGTWITLKLGDVFEDENADRYKPSPDLHFCSIFCLNKYTQERVT